MKTKLTLNELICNTLYDIAYHVWAECLEFQDENVKLNIKSSDVSAHWVGWCLKKPCFVWKEGFDYEQMLSLKFNNGTSVFSFSFRIDSIFDVLSKYETIRGGKHSSFERPIKHDSKIVTLGSFDVKYWHFGGNPFNPLSDTIHMDYEQSDFNKKPLSYIHKVKLKDPDDRHLCKRYVGMKYWFFTFSESSEQFFFTNYTDKETNTLNYGERYEKIPKAG